MELVVFSDKKILRGAGVKLMFITINVYNYAILTSISGDMGQKKNYGAI